MPGRPPVLYPRLMVMLSRTALGPMRPENAGAKGPPCLVNRQLHQARRRLSSARSSPLASRRAFKLVHLLLEGFVFFTHAHKVKVTIPHVLRSVLRGTNGREHRAGDFGAPAPAARSSRTRVR